MFLNYILVSISVVASKLTRVNLTQKRSFQSPEPPPSWGLLYGVFSVVKKINRNMKFKAFPLEYQGTFIFVEVILCQFTVYYSRKIHSV